MKKIITLAAVLAAGIGSALAQGAPPPGGPGGRPGMMNMPITVQDLGHRIVLLRSGSNSLLAEGSSGTIMIDTQFGDGKALVKKLAEVTKLPIKYVINSNPDGDHIAANALLAAQGAIMVASKNAAARLAVDQENRPGNITKALPPAARPTVIVTTTKTISIPGQTARITVVPPAHSDGDEFIYFPAANVLYIGDLLHSAEFPVYDGETSGCKCGSYTGQIQALDTVLGVINDTTIVVPGHGPVTDKAHVILLRDLLVWLKATLRADIAQGLTSAQVVASKPLAGKTTIFQQLGRDNSDQFVANAYGSIKAGH